MMTQSKEIERFLSKMSAVSVEIYSKHFPSKEIEKLWTYRRWGNRYAKGWRFSYMVKHKGATINHWQDMTIQKPEDFATAKQTIEKMGYKFCRIHQMRSYNNG